MGQIVLWTLVRIAVLIPVLWLAAGYVDYQFWWTIFILAVYGVVIHPAVVQYKNFVTRNKEVLEDTICSTCKHFDKSAVLCTMYDEHPKEDYIPCGGVDWEPKSNYL